MRAITPLSVPDARAGHSGVVILCPLDVELRALQERLVDVRPVSLSSGPYLYEGRIPESPLRVTFGLAGRGNNAAASTTRAVLVAFSPRAVLLVGIAGALHDLRLGDLIVPSSVYDYHPATDTADGRLSRSASWHPNAHLLELAQEVARDGTWCHEVVDSSQGAPPQVVDRPIASGEVVVQSARSATARLLAEEHSDAAGFETEAAGFLIAVHQCGDRPALVIRAISDRLDGKQDADRAGSQPVAAGRAATFALALVTRLAQEPDESLGGLDALANRLAKKVYDVWNEEAHRRDLFSPAPAVVRWRWGPADLISSREDFARDVLEREDGWPPATGPVASLFEDLYGPLDRGRADRGRLVVIGAPGAGKSAALLMLMLAMLTQRSELALRRHGIPVPVLLMMNSWDPSIDLLDFAADKICAYLGTDTRTDILTLLDDGQIALFLDGFDEMTDQRRGQALAELHARGRNLPLVLSSRPEEYRQAADGQPLHRAAVIEVQPVNADDALAYLVIGQAESRRPAWQHMGQILAAATGQPVSRALSTPLALWLLKRSYPTGDPAELADQTLFPDELSVRRHLFTRFLSVAYEQPARHPEEPDRVATSQAPDPVTAQKWLAWIADRMNNRTEFGWWQIPGWMPPRGLRAAQGVILGMPTAVATLAAGVLTAIMGGLDKPVGGSQVALLLCVILPLNLLLAALTSGFDGVPGRLRLRRPTARTIRRNTALLLKAGLPGWAVALAVTFGSACGWSSRCGAVPSAGWRLDLAVLGLSAVLSLPCALAVALLAACFASEPPTLSSARQAAEQGYRTDRRSTLVTATVGAGAVGTALVVLRLTESRSLAVLSLLLLLALPTVTATAALGRPAVRLLSAQVQARFTRMGAVRFLPLLSDAADRQVLVRNGTGHQFRHPELQEHLAQYHRTGGWPSTAAQQAPLSVPLAAALERLAAESGAAWCVEAQYRGIEERGLARTPAMALLLELLEAPGSGLVLLAGDRGSGRSNTLVQAMVIAWSRRPPVSGPSAPEMGRVPVLLSVDRWDPQTTSLLEWAATTLARDYPFLRARGFGTDAPGDLLRHRAVVLVLDGLDEMPPERWAGAVRRLDEESTGLRILLSCNEGQITFARRSRRWERAGVVPQAAPTRSAPDPEELLISAYPIEAERDQARRWLGELARRMRDQHDLLWWSIPDLMPARWARVLAVALVVPALWAYGLIAGPQGWIAFLVVVLVFGSFVVLAPASTTEEFLAASQRSLTSSGAATPWTSYRSELRFALYTTAFTAALLTVILLKWSTLESPFLVAIVPACALSAACGLLLLVTPVGQVWLVQLAALCTSRRPLHLLPLLEDARDRGILRCAGAAYQFRTVELQEHLALRTFTGEDA